MAIAVTSLGTGTDKTGSTFNVPVSGISAGDVLIVVAACDAGIDISTTKFEYFYDGSNSEFFDAIDVEIVNLDNVVTAIVRLHAVNASSGSPYVRWRKTVSTAGAMAIYKVTGLADNPFDKSNSGTGSGTDANTGATGVLSQADEIVFAASGVEDELDDPHGTWSGVTGNEQFAATNGGGDSSNIQVHSVAEIVAATTSKTGIDAGHDSTDWAACIATYKEAAAVGNVTVTPTTLSQTLTEYISILKEVTTPSTLSLSLTSYIPLLIFGTIIIPTTLNLSLTTYIPPLTISDNVFITPATLNLSDTEYIPILKETLTPTTLNLSDTEYIPVLKEVTTPSTISLILTFYVPDVTEPVAILVTPATLSLLLTGYIPVPAPGFGFYVGTINREPLWVSGPPKDIIFTDVEEEITFG